MSKATSEMVFGRTVPAETRPSEIASSVTSESPYSFLDSAREGTTQLYTRNNRNNKRDSSAKRRSRLRPLLSSFTPKHPCMHHTVQAFMHHRAVQHTKLPIYPTTTLQSYSQNRILWLRPAIIGHSLLFLDPVRPGIPLHPPNTHRALTLPPIRTNDDPPPTTARKHSTHSADVYPTLKALSDSYLAFTFDSIGRPICVI